LGLPLAQHLAIHAHDTLIKAIDLSWVEPSVDDIIFFLRLVGDVRDDIGESDDTIDAVAARFCLADRALYTFLRLTHGWTGVEMIRLNKRLTAELNSE
jgi:hypothetical protein